MKKPFSENEEQLLFDLIKENGTKNWGFISKMLNQMSSQPERNARECREKWKNDLDPKVSKS